jgi:hypothetical protein
VERGTDLVVGHAGPQVELEVEVRAGPLGEDARLWRGDDVLPSPRSVLAR